VAACTSNRKAISLAARLSVHMEATAASIRDLAGAAFLDGRADNAGTNALGQDQVVAGARPGIGQHRWGFTRPVTA